MISRLLTILLSLYIFCVSVQTADARIYSKENPLVYEDPLNLWPFSFLDGQGQPAGFNIDLIKMLMKQLGIPYIIKLKPQQEVLYDLKSHKADLTLGPTATFYDIHSSYSRHTVVLLTQSVATPKSSPVTIRTFRDLSRKGLPVIVKDSSLCHHLMLDYGWSANAKPSSDMSRTIRQVNEHGDGQIVWNTLSLQWLIRHYHLDNLLLTPVNMPHTEFKYMSFDPQLLNLLDKTYAKLYATGSLTPLEEKWFYPHDKPRATPLWTWCLAVMASLLLIVCIICLVRTLKQDKRIREANKKVNGQLTLLTEDHKVRFWTYNVKNGLFTWLDEHGKAAETCTYEEFGRRYNKEDFKQLTDHLARLSTQHKDLRGHEETELTLELKARDPEYADGKLHDFVVTLSVLTRDNDGKPAVIIATKKDVTTELQLKQQNNMRSLRYWTVFYNDESGVITFGADGYLQNANPTACELLSFDIDKEVEKHVHINQLLSTSFTDLNKTDGYRGTLSVAGKQTEYQIKTFCNNKGELLGLIVFCI